MGIGSSDAVLAEKAKVEKKDPGVEETPGLTISCKVAIGGQTDVGKSSLTNTILGDDRMTVPMRDTVDSVDTFSFDGTRLAWWTPRGSEGPVGRGRRRNLRWVGSSAVKRCDVAVLMLDGQHAPTAQDRRIGLHANNKASML